MSNLIGFLESVGSNAAMRHASRAALQRALHLEEIEASAQVALLQPARSALDGLLGVRETMWCNNQAVKPPKKAPAKKKPAKKAPAKKAPAKRKK